MWPTHGMQTMIDITGQLARGEAAYRKVMRLFNFLCLFMAITNTSAEVKQGSTTLTILHKHFMIIFVHTFASVI